MAFFSPVEPAVLRQELSDAIRDLSLQADGSLSGEAFFGPTLVGPPGRLHGGLHAYARLLPVLQALPQHSDTPRVRVRLSLLKALALEAPIPLTGRYQGGDDWRLETRFHGTERLDAVATPAEPVPAGLLEHFRALRQADRSVVTIQAAGTISMRIGSALVSAEAPTPAALDTGHAISRFLHPDGHADAVWMCGALDLLAAVVQGFAWQSHVLTVRMDLTLAAERVDGPVLLLADQQTRPDALVPLRPLEVSGQKRGATVVSVLLTDPAIQSASAWGAVSLYPARKRLV